MLLHGVIAILIMIYFRVITAALQDSHIDQLKREIKGVQNLYRSLASSVSNFRARIMDENQTDETNTTETEKKKKGEHKPFLQYKVSNFIAAHFLKLLN